MCPSTARHHFAGPWTHVVSGVPVSHAFGSYHIGLVLSGVPVSHAFGSYYIGLVHLLASEDQVQ